MTSSRILVLVAGLAVTGGAVDDAVAQSKAGIQQMDRDGDGVVTATEWQGQTGAFRLHDTNRDGVLSGTEVWDARDLPARGRDRNRSAFDDWTPEGFARLDNNRDGQVTTDEWGFDRPSFRRADHNHDNVISRAEFLNEDGVSANRANRFRHFDTNNDGVIDRGEWQDSDVAFRALDQNRDNRLTRAEFRGVSATTGTITRSNAYRAGYERGQSEGRAAGREDRDRNQGWDVDGQRELEAADSGYDVRVGPKSEYQAGYRDGFRPAYREGWDRR
jgi:Ca2+-binding EF-hand superfamily protein